MNYKIAVILVNYNGLEDTIDCINSIKRSTTNSDIIIVDNASSGNDAEIIENKYSDVIVLKESVNLGFAGGNNIGIKYAMQNGYEYVLLLNNDTVIDPDMISNMLLYADDNTVVIPKMFYYSHKNELWYGEGKIDSWTGNVKIYDNLAYCEPDFITGCCMLLHKDIINKVGCLPEDYFMYCEDLDYSIILKQNGIRMISIQDAKLWHKVGKSSGGKSSCLSVYYNTRNRILIIRKFPKQFKITAMPYTILTRFLRMLQYRANSWDSWKFFLYGIRDGLHGITGYKNLNDF